MALESPRCGKVKGFGDASKLLDLEALLRDGENNTEQSDGMGDEIG